MSQKQKKIVPYPYQAIAIPDCVKALRTAGMALCVMATGLGKTFTSAFIAKEFGAKRILFLVHNNFILSHAKDEFVQVFGPAVSMSFYNGMEKRGAEKAAIVFATWQTMRDNLENWKKSHFDLVIVDEAHHADADTYKPVAQYFTGPRLGLTATPPEPGDKKDIRDLFGPEVVNITREEAIARGWLPRIEYHVITDKSLNEDELQKIVGEIRESKKRFTMAEVNRRVFIRKRDNEIAKIINGYDEKAIVFCPNIPYADRFAKQLHLCETFHSSKEGANGNNTHAENQRVLKHLHDGIIRRVCAVNAFNEGVNVPSVGLVAFCRCTETRRVFDQQLGRGMRQGKNKLIVLDFVSNLERIQLVSEMVKKIADMHENFTSEEERLHEGYEREKFEVSGAGFEFTFSDKIVDLMKVLEHTQADFYPSWQEASVVAIRAGFKSGKKYVSGYKNLDHRLPSNPPSFYSDFPGWGTFLGTGNTLKGNFYPTWEKASHAVKKLGIKSANEYYFKRKGDKLLTSVPDKYYKNFPGWAIFLGVRNCGSNFYPTWQQASSAAKKLKIRKNEEYLLLYKKDPRLPSSPRKSYPDFPGWPTFLDNGRYERGSNFYETWQQAAEAVRKAGINSGREYSFRRKEDLRLPSLPREFYDDFPGWSRFLGKK